MTVKQIENEIIKKHLPFWMGIKDEKFGGCFGYMDGRGKIDETADKSVLLVSRCLYFFSDVYTVYPDPQVREIAESYYQYINAHYLDADGGIIYSVSFDGKVKDETKNVYFHAFVIYAFMKYYHAFRKKEALKKALKLFYFIEDKVRAKVAYNEQLYSAARSENMIADKGVKCYKITEKTGNVVGVKAVNEENEIMLITTEGIIIRLQCSGISILGRITSGVKLMDMAENISVASIAKVREKKEENTEETEVETEEEMTQETVESEQTAEEEQKEE